MYYTGVGSRKAPEHVLELMTDIGVVLCQQGFTLRTGCAGGADEAFRSRVPSSKREVYVPADAEIALARGEAKELAREARGSFKGLNEDGILLHTRNAFQVLGITLTIPSEFLIFYAEPDPTREGVFKGGTNTAVQIAKRFDIPVFNLYEQKVFDKFKNRVDTLLGRLN